MMAKSSNQNKTELQELFLILKMAFLCHNLQNNKYKKNNNIMYK